MSAKWTADRIPDQTGRLAVVTGANSGLGLITAQELARKGARVVLACRNLEKADRAQSEIRSAVPGADVSVRELDLGSLASIEAFSDALHADEGSLDLLINNAGLMAPPRRETADGFEVQIGTNHLGHFALTGRLIDLLLGVDGARVVTLSSGAHRIGKMTFDDLQRKERYFRWTAYGQSKLANLLFMFELDRRLRAAGSDVLSVAAHPGYAATNLQSSNAPLVDKVVMAVANKVIAQSAAMGALPTLYAATEPGLVGGTFIGPDGPGEQRGFPQPVGCTDAARDEVAARRLWSTSEELTGVTFDLGAGAAA